MGSHTHRILLSTFVIDVPADVHDQTVTFWAAALGAIAKNPGAKAQDPPPGRSRRCMGHPAVERLLPWSR
jgi:hypothetical protein